MTRRISALLPFAVFLILTVVSWQRWIEPYVDSGRELDAPWRIARGERLYRDVRFFHGPLGPYLAAGVDAVAGRSIPARVALCAAVALVHVEILRRLARRLSSRGSLAAAVVVAVAFFLRPGGCHLFPFSLDTSIAAASIAAALLFAAFDPSARRDAAAGACLGAALLSRPEMGLAAAAVLAWETRLSRRALAVVAAPLLAASLVYAGISIGVPWETLRREGWLAILGPPEAFRNIYAAYAGLDRPALRLAELALAAVLLIVIGSALVGVAAASVRASASNARRGAWVEAAAIAALAAAAASVLRPPDSARETVALLPPLVRVVPIAAISLALARVALSALGRRYPSGAENFKKERMETPPVANEEQAPLATTIFVPDAVLFVAALFGARLLLAAGYVGPYNGFLLPLPLLVVASALLRAAGRAADSVGASLPRLTAGAFAVFLLFRVAALRDSFRAPGWSRVETPAGALFLTEPVAGATRLALADLALRVRAGGTLAGFPEVGFVNYALGLENPLPQEQFFPGHLDAAEENATIRRLTARPPAALLLANVVAVGHGSRVFGKDYLVGLDRFVHERFAPAASYGPGAGPRPRIGDPDFFLEVRVPAAPPRP